MFLLSYAFTLTWSPLIYAKPVSMVISIQLSEEIQLGSILNLFIDIYLSLGPVGPVGPVYPVVPISLVLSPTTKLSFVVLIFVNIPFRVLSVVIEFVEFTRVYFFNKV